MQLKLVMRVPAAEPGAGAKTRLTEEGRGAVQVGNAWPSCRTGGWREDPADRDEDPRPPPADEAREADFLRTALGYICRRGAFATFGCFYSQWGWKKTFLTKQADFFIGSKEVR